VENVVIYGDYGDNPALNEIAIGAPLRELCATKGLEVRTIWDGIAGLRTGRMILSADVTTYIGGYDKKRWVTEVTVHVPYAAAEELGRHAYNPYEGTHALNHALHAVLPTEI
jgi:hypothetical protein